MSEFAINPESKIERICDRILPTLLIFLKTSNIEIVRSNIFGDYETIKQKIQESNLTIALVDTYWTSSTWKAQELNYAIDVQKENSEYSIIVYLDNVPKDAAVFSKESSIVFVYKVDDLKKEIKRQLLF